MNEDQTGYIKAEATEYIKTYNMESTRHLVGGVRYFQLFYQRFKQSENFIYIYFLSFTETSFSPSGVLFARGTDILADDNYYQY